MSEINKSKVLPRLVLSRGGKEGQANGCRFTEDVFCSVKKASELILAMAAPF